MKIICPQCNFLKDVPEERFPSSSFMATCPKCKYRFRVSIENNEIKKDENLSVSNNNQANISDDYGKNMQVDKDDLFPHNATIPNDYQNVDSRNNSEIRDNNSEIRDNNSEIRDNNSEIKDNNSEIKENNSDIGDNRYEDEYATKRVDLRKKADNVYKNESRRRLEEELNDDFAIDNPWDNPQSAGYISSFYQTVIRIMFFAPRFFAGLSNVSLIKSLIFYVLVVVLQILISSFWASTLFQYITNNANGSDEIHTLLSYVSDSKLPMILLVKAAFSVVQLYVSSFIYYLAFSMVVKEKVDFSLVFQVIAYSIAPLLLSVVPLLGSLVGMVWAIACSFIGCRYALRLTIMQTALALAPIYLLILPLLYIIISVPT